MKIYFATVDDYENKSMMQLEHKNILCSYHYFKDKIKFYELKKLYERMKEDDSFSLLIDSGAFSAHNSGERIGLPQYMDWLKRLKPELYIALDVIGNSEKTQVNTQRMLDAGFNPIPTFHMGGELHFLYDMLDHHDYISLGGMVFSSGKIPWLDEIWRIILTEKPTLKVHGLGLTSRDEMERYPWYSVDSSSFKAGKRYGRVTLLNELNELYTISDMEFIRTYAVANSDNTVKAKGKKRYSAMDKASAQAYSDLVSLITEQHKTKDFSFLTAQGKLF